jgi:hypothetical protein
MSRSTLREVAVLNELSRDELLERWRDLFGTEPPRYSRQMLIGRLAYRIQELAFGGLSEVARNQLEEHLGADEIDGEEREVQRMERRKRKQGMPVVGTRLIREWQGQRYEVTVVPGGFEYEGRRYRSLTSVTKAITGTHWNGPAFFGLRKPETKGS